MKKFLSRVILSFTFYFIINNAVCIAQWVQCNGPYSESVWCLHTNGTNFFAGTNTGVFISTNNGNSWTQTSLNYRIVKSLTSSGNNIIAGTYIGSGLGYGIYRSTDGGNNWSQTPLNNKQVYSLINIGNNIFAGTSTGVYISTNNGSNWTQTGISDKIVYALTYNANSIFAGCNSYGVYISTNNGTNWQPTAIYNKSVWSLLASGTNIFAGADNGVYLSTNNGNAWTLTSLISDDVKALTISGNNIFAGSYEDGVYLSSNMGVNWIQKSQGFPSLPRIVTLLIDYNYIFAGTEFNSLWKRLISEIIVIKLISSEIPFEYHLNQNFPNPFNPTTKIQYAIPINEYVRIVILDITGREIETIVEEKQNAGIYEVSFTATRYTSGVYFYKIITNNYTDTKKMILLR